MKNLARKFGTSVFDDVIMLERLPATTYQSLRRSIDLGVPLEPEVAGIVAAAMKEWAVEQGATHFTHWFQPMTGITAGKHDSFLTPQGNGTVMLEFSGKELIKGEPDASSFPNGGLRNTFEARGYTVWDCTSPAFVWDKTLYIPTAFCSYNGEALDAKTPLLRSMEALSVQALRILRLFGNTSARHVESTVGAEQEYFLVDRALYEKRLDLKICGRTPFGAQPPKGQEMDDHYCGRIRLRIADYMHQLDEALWKLGIPSKTKHNEVAPAQHELAPVFESCNVAADHNQLTMDIMRMIAKRNGLACLLHEKPFEQINGSGKHNNWSLSTSDGVNLFHPGKTPYENIQFLVFVCAVIRAVDRYAGLLRMTSAYAGNDLRLGGQEAPPSIISIFLGNHLTDILTAIARGEEEPQTMSDVLVTSVATLPNLQKDDSDRNRTSPFAFTGNKFEFRMLGSSASISSVNMVLNTIVAESLETFADRLERSKDFDAEIRKIITDTVNQHGRILFNGNGYTTAWREEAQRRGLLNIPDAVRAAEELLQEETVQLFEHFGVLSQEECRARYEIMLEKYSKTVEIEARTMLQMACQEMMPAVVRYCGDVADRLNSLEAAGMNVAAVRKRLEQLTHKMNAAFERVDALKHSLNTLPSLLPELAVYCRNEIRPRMEQLRRQVDALETEIEKKEWPIPDYTDLLHRV